MIRWPVNGVSNGLSGELKFRIFEELIEEDNELPHDGGQRHFLGFAGSDQSLIKYFQDWVESRRNDSGHIQHAADLDAASAAPFVRGQSASR